MVATCAAASRILRVAVVATRVHANIAAVVSPIVTHRHHATFTHVRQHGRLTMVGAASSSCSATNPNVLLKIAVATTLAVSLRRHSVILISATASVRAVAVYTTIVGVPRNDKVLSHLLLHGAWVLRAN